MRKRILAVLSAAVLATALAPAAAFAARDIGVPLKGLGGPPDPVNPHRTRT